MTKREELNSLIEGKQEQIVKIRSEITELYRESRLLSDEVCWFTEEIEHHPKHKYQRNENWLDGKLVGRVHWIMKVPVVDEGRELEIERSNIVRLNGEWLE
jgi:hypothetical protein